jgi:DNA polymerase/3'-5' exonuclease PolX
MRNAELARCFRDIAGYLDMDGVPFKPRAYEKAAQAIEAHDRPLAEVHRAGGVKRSASIPGVGKSMAEKLAEFSRPAAASCTRSIAGGSRSTSPPSRSSRASGRRP